MPRVRRGLAAVAVEGEVIAIGGGTPAPGKILPVNWTEVYDPSTRAWRSLAAMPTPRDAVDAVIVDGKVFVIGGSNWDNPSPRNMNEVEAYDPSTDTWEKRPPAPHWGEFGLDAMNDTIYALALNSGETFAYDPTTEAWVNKTHFPPSQNGVPDIWRLLGTRLVSAGGLYPTVKGDTWAYDLSNDSWVKLAAMPTGRVNAGRVVFNDRLYVAGGQTGGISQVTNAFEEYDPITNTWRQLLPMSVARDEVAAVTLDDEIYVLGGRAEPTYYSLVEKYSMKLLYEWDFGDGSPTSEGKVVEHAYSSVGTYHVNLTVVDPKGAEGTDSCAVTVLASNRSPTVNAGGPYAGYEGTPLTLTATAADPDNDPLTYRWDFDNDGTADTSWSSSPATFHTWGDDFTGTVMVEVSDNKTTANATATVAILNLPPTIDSLAVPAINATATLRIAGEKWHDVSAYLVDGGNETLVAKLARQPGKPQETSFPVTIDMTRGQSVRVEYTPQDDKVNGQPNGATPAWLDISFDSGPPVEMRHTFNVRHPETYNWTVSLNQLLAGREVKFTATATDPGMDDLTFIWDWGDGTPVAVSSCLNGGLFPFTATDTRTHEYAMAGMYELKLTVGDDDGGVIELPLVVVVI